MRFGGLLVLLAGCFSAPTSRNCVACNAANANPCPSGLVCSAGFCVASVGDSCETPPITDGGDDPDVPLGLCLLPPPGSEHVALSLLSPLPQPYSVPENLPVAYFQRQQDIERGPLNETSGFMIVLDGIASVELYSNAFISPDDKELYVTVDENGDNTGALTTGMSQLVGTFQPPQQVVFEDEDGTILTTLDGATGTTTRPNPATRRMMVAAVAPLRPPTGSELQMFELEQRSELRWRVVQRTLPSDLGLVGIRQPNITPDGLNVVFVGSTDQTVAIYALQRGSLAAPFSHAPTMIVDSGDESFPVLRADCQTLYYYRESSQVTPGVVRFGAP